MATTLTARVADEIGVTRIARVTGLDRAGVEVAAAIRPGGHVLQVCNGKGETWERAALGAVLEAAELAWAEHVDHRSLVYGSRRELTPRGAPDRVWSASELGSAGRLVDPALWSDDVVCAWRRGRDLLSRREVLVPAQAVHCPPPDAVALGPISVAWTTNGSGAHPDPDAALLHALLEAAERDQLARVLPDGWTSEALISRRLQRGSLEASAPRAA
ncbi:MAG: YcaO-like family protein, partial [Myxococcaceae bacterium]